jgi:hypothetical protein
MAKPNDVKIISANGNHQLALRKISANVFDGATKVSTTLSTWLNPVAAGTGAPTLMTASFDMTNTP